MTLTILYGQTRIFFAMSRDGLLPQIFARLSAAAARPAVTTLMFGVLIAIMAALLPLSEIAKLVNIGTLFAFLIVNIGVIILRRTQPDLERGFRVPFVPVFPIIGVGAVHLPDELPRARHLAAVRRLARCSAWSSTSCTGATHSRLQRGEGPDAERAELGVAPPGPGRVASRAAMKVDYGLDAPRVVRDFAIAGARSWPSGRSCSIVGRPAGRAGAVRPRRARCSWRPSAR